MNLFSTHAGKNGGILGARVYPTREGNMELGIDVMAWIELRLTDYLMP